MTPLTQTELYDPTRPDHRGNCWQTVIASLLELPLDAVPHFVQDDHDHHGAHEWHWWNRTLDFLRDRGHRLDPVTDMAAAPGEYLIVMGKSPRAGGTVHHAVIYRDGVMVHDPHPDRTGLVTIDATAYAIRRLAATHDDQVILCECGRLLSACEDFHDGIHREGERQ